jgi:hypothetical protein
MPLGPQAFSDRNQARILANLAIGLVGRGAAPPQKRRMRILFVFSPRV